MVRLLFKFLGEISHGAVLHHAGEAMVHAGRLLALRGSLRAKIAKARRGRNLVPVELAVLALPRTIVENANAPLAHRNLVLFLTGDLARLAARAEFVIDEQSIRCHLDHQLSKTIPNFHHVRVVVLSDRLHAAEQALERCAEAELANVLMWNELVDV